ncbi:MAG: helix-hairpin-helix domain-containing protein, partial [Eudoraea sp.]
GIFFLLLFIFLFQILYWSLKYFDINNDASLFIEDLEFQDKLSEAIDLHEIKKSQEPAFFNPNFISDYKGYALGLSNEEIDRLHQYRKAKKWIYSAHEFQKITLVSDSLLMKLSPLFKFPEWANKQKVIGAKTKQQQFSEKKNLNDINLATETELQRVYGIGEKLSNRIIRFRTRLGGFVSNQQLFHVYGLEDNVVKNLLAQYEVKGTTKISLIDINTASSKVIREFIYFDREAANGILRYRDSAGIIKSWSELEKIENFPLDKIEIIKLYLSL